MYHYNIVIDGLVCADFAEVSGGELADEVIEFRDGSDRIVQSGLKKQRTVTLKYGRSSNRPFIDWIIGSDTEAATYEKVIIALSDGKSDAPIGVWELTKIWPLKYEAANLKTNVDEVEFECIKLVCESMKRIQ